MIDSAVCQPVEEFVGNNALGLADDDGGGELTLLGEFLQRPVIESGFFLGVYPGHE